MSETKQGVKLVNKFITWVYFNYPRTFTRPNQLLNEFSLRIQANSNLTELWEEKTIVKFLIRVAFSEIGWTGQVEALKYVLESEVSPFTLAQKNILQLVINPNNSPLELTNKGAEVMVSIWDAIERQVCKIRDNIRLDMTEKDGLLLASVADAFIEPIQLKVGANEALQLLTETVNSMKQQGITFSRYYKSPFPRKENSFNDLCILTCLIRHVIPIILFRLSVMAEESKVTIPDYTEYKNLFYGIICTIPEYVAPDTYLLGFEADIIRASCSLII